MDINITKDSVLMINKKKHTIEQFMTKFAIDSEEKAIEVATTLVNQGKAFLVEKESKENILLKKAAEEDIFMRIANQISEEEESAKQAKRNEKLEDTDVLKIALDFDTTINASKFDLWLDSLGIKDTEISIKGGNVKLIVNNISPDEYSKITKKYQLENAVKKTVNTSKNISNTVTDTVGYAATEIIVPLGTIAEELAWGVGKTAVHVIAKTGATLVNTGAKAIAETKYALDTDPELIKATSKVIEAKNNILKFLGRKTKASSKGINIIED